MRWNDCRYEEEQREVRRRRRRRVVASKLRRQRKMERYILIYKLSNKTICSMRQKTTKFRNSFKYGCSLFFTSQNTENLEFRLNKWKVNLWFLVGETGGRATTMPRVRGGSCQEKWHLQGRQFGPLMLFLSFDTGLLFLVSLNVLSILCWEGWYQERLPDNNFPPSRWIPWVDKKSSEFIC